MILTNLGTNKLCAVSCPPKLKHVATNDMPSFDRAYFVVNGHSRGEPSIEISVSLKELRAMVRTATAAVKKQRAGG